MNTLTVTKKFFSNTDVGRAQPGFSDDVVYLYLYLGYLQSAFAVYDVASDSLVYQYDLSPGYGEVKQSPEGSYAVFTNSGSGFDAPYGPKFVYVYDAAAGYVTDTIVTARMTIDTTEMTLDANALFINGRGDRLLLLPAGVSVEYALLQFPRGTPLDLDVLNSQSAIVWISRYGSM